MKETDLAVIGAGPAGLAAATTAAQYGAKVILLDEQVAPGGQVYRHLESNRMDTAQTRILGKDYLAGNTVIDLLRTAPEHLQYLPLTTVWQAAVDGVISYSHSGQAAQCKARHIIIATGAQERSVALPGWTLPGVMSIGAAQILLKSAAMVPEAAVLIGAGPLLYLYADQLIKADAAPRALIETQSLSDYIKALRFLPRALRGWPTLHTGLNLLKRIQRAGVARYTGATQIALLGADAVTGISFYSRGGVQQLACTSAFLHHGVVPNTQLSRSLGLVHTWSERQRCFHPLVGNWGETDTGNISIAGDGAGIAGAGAAAIAGKRSALHALYMLGILEPQQRDNEAALLQPIYAKERAPRAFLDTLYAPPSEVLRPADGTVICRCEEVTAGDVRSYAKLGCIGPNQTKAFGRCGMGPCQGRFCALAVTEILSQEHALHPSIIGSYRVRSPIKPISLGELASLRRCNTLVPDTLKTGPNPEDDKVDN